MRILLTGGGTGGHFYPVIAVAEAIQEIAKEQKFIPPQIYFMSSDVWSEKVLFEHNIIFKRAPSGKNRLYFSVWNFFDIFKIIIGVIKALFQMFSIYPDVVFGKGGYGSLPALWAARILRIPVIIHESDSVPGRTNKWASKFAVKVAVSYPKTSEYFLKEKTAHTGQPIRDEIKEPLSEGAIDYFGFSKDLPVLLILGGSQGAKKINDLVLDSLSELVERYQIIHQTGDKNIDEVKKTSDLILSQNTLKGNYKPYPYLSDLELRMSAGISSLVVSRAGSSIFEIAAWRLPSIIIPITESNGDHQRQNAFNYARGGACIVLEENNLTPHIFLSELERVLKNPLEIEKMKKNTEQFYTPDAGRKIANQLLSIALKHV